MATPAVVRFAVLEIVRSVEIPDELRRHTDDRPVMRVLLKADQCTADVSFKPLLPHERGLILGATSLHGPDVADQGSHHLVIVTKQPHCRLFAALVGLDYLLNRIAECIG